MIDEETIIVAHRGEEMRRAFHDWDVAREWEDVVRRNYTLTEVLIVND